MTEQLCNIIISVNRIIHYDWGIIYFCSILLLQFLKSNIIISVNRIIHYDRATFYFCFTISKHISLHNCTHILSSQNMTIIKSIKSKTENDTHKSVRGNFDPPWIPFVLKCYKGKLLQYRISLTNSRNIKYHILTQEVENT